MIEIQHWTDLKKLPRLSKWEAFRNRLSKIPNYKVVIFGAGDQGMMAALLLHENGIVPYAFCDNDKAKQGTRVKGLPVLSPAETAKLGKNTFVINNDSYRQEKREQLLRLGMDEAQIVTLDIFNPLFKGLTRAYVEAHEAEFQSTLSLLADEASRHAYLYYLAGVFTGDLDYFASVKTAGEYFPKEIVPQRNDHVFLDVGAYNGNTVEEFREHFSKYDRIYAFEPFASSATEIQKKQFPRTELINAAASDKDGIETFYCNDYGDLTMVTTIQEKGSNRKAESFRTIRIDSVLGNTSEKAGQCATFIKMDIEGSELAALHGAEETIRRWRPFLAICVYHKKEDLFTIPAYVHTLMPEGKLYLRHHSSGAVDFIFYAFS